MSRGDERWGIPWRVTRKCNERRREEEREKRKEEEEERREEENKQNQSKDRKFANLEEIIKSENFGG
jgi:hypothetical protein